MTTCITDARSKAYMTKLVRDGVPMYFSFNENDYFRIYGPRKRGRSLMAQGKKLLSFFKKIPKNSNYPRFVPMNLYLNNKGEKHSVVIILTTAKGHEGEIYRLELFDPNGEYIFYDENVYEWDEWDEWHRQTLDIVEATAVLLFEETNTPVEVVQSRKGYKSINTFGGGNCDAITLYYITLRSRGYDMEEANKIMEKLTIKQTNAINNYITSLGKKGGLV